MVRHRRCVCESVCVSVSMSVCGRACAPRQRMSETAKQSSAQVKPMRDLLAQRGCVLVGGHGG